MRRFLLLQARNPGDGARADEHAAFAARLGVPPAAITSVDLLREPLHAGLLEGHAALLVGGAGEYGVVDPVPPVRRFIDFLAEVAESGFPVFASCFGFQALVVGLGGEVRPDPDRAEVGTYPLRLTEAGAADPLFGELPRRFLAQLGHQDRATRLPAGVVHLAASDRAPYQALRLPGRPVYATQFHPELTDRDNRARFLRYMATYGRLFGEAAARERLDSHRPSPEANRLLARFAALFLGDGEGGAGGAD